MLPLPTPPPAAGWLLPAFKLHEPRLDPVVPLAVATVHLAPFATAVLFVHFCGMSEKLGARVFVDTECTHCLVVVRHSRPPGLQDVTRVRRVVPCTEDHCEEQ